MVVRLIGPDGTKLREVDSPNGTQGPEPLSLIVEQVGKYTVEVESLEKTGQPGNYELKLEPIKPATSHDLWPTRIMPIFAVQEFNLGRPFGASAHQSTGQSDQSL